MYDFTESGNSDLDDALEWTSSQPMHSQSEREWSRMSDQFVNAGYREGITVGKESALQGGFDSGFAGVGAPIGRHVGILRGLAAGVLSFLDSSCHQCLQPCELSTLHDDVRGIVEQLSRLRFADVKPPDTEALAHVLEHGDDPRVRVFVETGRKGLPELIVLRERLLEALQKLGLDVVFDVPTIVT